jgi:hypothetical protein
MSVAESKADYAGSEQMSLFDPKRTFMCFGARPVDHALRLADSGSGTAAALSSPAFA